MGLAFMIAEDFIWMHFTELGRFFFFKADLFISVKLVFKPVSLKGVISFRRLFLFLVAYNGLLVIKFLKKSEKLFTFLA